MFLWIRDQKWLPALSVSLVLLLVNGGIDLALQGQTTIYASLVLCASVAFARALPILAVILAALGLPVSGLLGLDTQVSQFAATITILIVSAFAAGKIRIYGPIAIATVWLVSLLWFFIEMPADKTFYGLPLVSSSAKVALSVSGALVVISINLAAWILGRLLFTQITHVGTDFDRALLERQVASAQLNMAEQDRRFGIAKDVTELLLEELNATMVAAESGSYAVQSDSSAAPRILSSIQENVRKAYAELRRLSDLLQLQDANAKALPGLRDLNGLFVSYREFGYSVNFKETGESMVLNDGAALIVYRIVFESFENTRKHAPIGTGIDVDFIWTDSALQILIKDNGEEVARAASLDESGYGIEEDQKALVERLTGPGLTAMAERVALFDGIIEFTRVPGVGFTVSASFPEIVKHSKVS